MVSLQESKEVVMIVSKITSKGQVTLPKKIREYLKVDVSDTIEFTLLEGGKVLITSEKKSAEALFGMLNHRKTGKRVTVEEMDAAVKNQRKKRHAG
jgi:AbrB family looped-hinge helix DNA binding protein